MMPRISQFNVLFGALIIASAAVCLIPHSCYGQESEDKDMRVAGPLQTVNSIFIEIHHTYQFGYLKKFNDLWDSIKDDLKSNVDLLAFSAEASRANVLKYCTTASKFTGNESQDQIMMKQADPTIILEMDIDYDKSKGQEEMLNDIEAICDSVMKKLGEDTIIMVVRTWWRSTGYGSKTKVVSDCTNVKHMFGSKKFTWL